jgi:hypothetical protein
MTTTQDHLLGTVRSLFEGLERPLPNALKEVRPVALEAGYDATSPTAIAEIIGAAFERVIAARSGEERARRGTHLTPARLARVLAGQALDRCDPQTILDPCCGAGMFLAAAAEIRARKGQPPLRGLFARDVEPLALVATRWSLQLGFPGAAISDLDLACGDALIDPLPAVDLVLTNPPFRSLVRRRNDAERAHHKRLRSLWQPALSGRSDLVAAFVQAAVEVTAPQGTAALLVPESLLTTEAATGLRAWVCENAPPARIDLLGPGHFGDAQVRVATLVLTRAAKPTVECLGSGRRAAVPAARFASGAWAEALPPRELLPDFDSAAATSKLGEEATVHRRFTDDFYFLNRSVENGETNAPHPLITVGAIDPGRWLWGIKSVRVGGQRMLRPAVNAALLRGEDSVRADRLLRSVERPRIALATRSRVLEATWLPSGAIAQVPVIEVACENPAALHLIYAQLLSPPATRAYLAAYSHYDQTGAGIELRSKALQSLPLIPPQAIKARAKATLIESVDALITEYCPDRLRAIQQQVLALYGAPNRALIDWWWARLPKRMTRAK